VLREAERAYYGAMLCEIRAAVSQSVVDHMRVVETEMQAHAEKRRIKLERRLIK
jgi:hypothetical protein